MSADVARGDPGRRGIAVRCCAACAAQPPTAPAQPTPQVQRPRLPRRPPFRRPTHPGLTLAAVGDMMLGTDFPENILPDDDGLSFFDAVTPILEKPDVTFGNLEGVLLDGGEPVKLCKDKRICFLFRTPTRYATYFKLAGFDVMSLANNHARDFGEEGRSSSMAALDARGIHAFGPRGHHRELDRERPAHRAGRRSHPTSVPTLLNDPQIATAARGSSWPRHTTS